MKDRSVDKLREWQVLAVSLYLRAKTEAGRKEARKASDAINARLVREMRKRAG